MKRHPFQPSAADPLTCSVCGHPYQSVTKGRDAWHPMDKRGRSTK